MVEEEVCCVEEDEAYQEDKAHQEEEEETTDIKMVNEEERGNPESSGPLEANTEDIPLWSLLEILSPLRRMLSSCSKHPNLKIPRLDLTAPGVRPARSWEGWLSYASLPQTTLCLRRMRPHYRSLPFSDIA